MKRARKRSRRSRGPEARLRKLSPTARLPLGTGLRDASESERSRLLQIISRPLECVFDPRFSRSNAEAIFAPADITEKLLQEVRPHVDAARKTLSAVNEQTYFLRYNYARYRMVRILEEHRGSRLSISAARELIRWDEIARRLCDDIVQANLGLIPTMIERSRVNGMEFAELISEGQFALLRSVEKFDCGRGFKFSTYACRSILTAIARAVALLARHRSHFPMEFDPDFQSPDLLELREAFDDEDTVRALTAVLKSNTADLTRTEKKILSERFGFDARLAGDKDAVPKTLREIASIFGVTKERVRQIQNRALEKIRNALEPSPVGD